MSYPVWKLGGKSQPGSRRVITREKGGWSWRGEGWKDGGRGYDQHKPGACMEIPHWIP